MAVCCGGCGGGVGRNAGEESSGFLVRGSFLATLLVRSIIAGAWPETASSNDGILIGGGFTGNGAMG